MLVIDLTPDETRELLELFHDRQGFTPAQESAIAKLYKAIDAQNFLATFSSAKDIAGFAVMAVAFLSLRDEMFQIATRVLRAQDKAKEQAAALKQAAP